MLGGKAYWQMACSFLQYVAKNSPRCIAALKPIPVSHVHPTLFLPPELSVYRHLVFDAASTVTFEVGCPCGSRVLKLSGYYMPTESRSHVHVFVGPLRVECQDCHLVSDFFDTRKHGYDGEQDCNTHMIGEGVADDCACPSCGLKRMIIYANFTYSRGDDLPNWMSERPQDFFDGFNLIGKCTGCYQTCEIASFECD